MGISRFKNKRVPETDPNAALLLKKWESNAHQIFNFIHSRLTPAIRPLAHELYFPEGQIEADGLTVICAKIWTATFILSQEFRNIEAAQIEDIRLLFMELVWGAEKAMKVNQIFYTCQQKFKKHVLPHVWEMEDKYCTEERREFVDPELREDLKEPRPLDGLYLHDRLKIKSLDDLSLFVTTKSSWQTLSHKENRVPFKSLQPEKKLEIIHSLLTTSLKSYQKVTLGIETHYRTLAEGNLLSDMYPIKCTDAFELNSSYLNSICNSVYLSVTRKQEINERVGIILDQTSSYLIVSQWICDRLAEIAGMIRLSYRLLSIGCHLNWQDYGIVSAQAGEVVDMLHVNNKKRHPKITGYNWRNSAKREYEEAFETFLSGQVQVNQGSPQSGGDQKLNQSLKQQLESLQVRKDFLSTEYPWLLTKLPILIDDMKLMFQIRATTKTKGPRIAN